MPLTSLCVPAAVVRSVFAAFSRPMSGAANALTPSVRMLTGRYIQDSLVVGDTTALSVPNLHFTPCSDLGGCGSGTLVGSPATYAGRTQAVCCGMGMCASNPSEEWVQIPDRQCPSDGIASFPTEIEAQAACLADDDCRAVEDLNCDRSGEFRTCSSSGSWASSSCMYDRPRQQPDFACLAGSLIPAANTTPGYDTSTCCEGFTCAQNDIGPDFPCSELTLPKPAAEQIAAYSQEECCERCADRTYYRNATQTCTSCPYPSRCVGGACVAGATGDACASCQLTEPRYFQVGSSCRPCPDSPAIAFIIATVVVAVLIIVAVHKATDVVIADDVATSNEHAEATNAKADVDGEDESKVKSKWYHKTATGSVSDAHRSAAAASRGVYDAQQAAALAYSISSLSIYISITMPHWQLLGTCQTQRSPVARQLERPLTRQWCAGIIIDLDLSWPGFLQSVAAWVLDFFSLDL